MAAAVTIIEFIRQFPPGVQIIEFFAPRFFCGFFTACAALVGD
jgi:hypothetical protein